MIDSLTSSIATILNAKRDTAFQSKVLKNSDDLKDLAIKVVNALYDIHNLKVDSDNEENAFYDNCLSGMIDIYDKIVNNAAEQPEEPNLAQLGTDAIANMVSSGNSNDKDSAVFESMNKSLNSLVKLNQTQVTQEANLGKVLNKVEKTIGAPEKKTKIVDTTENKSEVDVGTPIIDPSKIDMSGVAKSMAASAASALNPAKLIKAFFSELLPYVIIFGLLLYGFITGYLGGDVYDFILVLGGTILAAFLLYIAYQYIKANILFAFKILCEMIKLNLAFAVQALQIVAIGLIVVAFLLVAGLMLILFGAAFLLIAKGAATLIETITDSILKFLSFGVETIAKIPAMIGEMFGKIIRGIFGGKSDDEDKKESSLFSLFHTSIIPKMDDIINAIKDNKVIQTETVNELTGDSKNAEIEMEDGVLLSYLNELTTDTHSIAGLVADILNSNAEKESEIIKQVASSVLEQNTRSVMNSYQITDGTAVLRDTTAYASSESESTGGTDISQVIAQLGKIVSHLNDIYETEKKIAAGKDKSIWAGLGLS